MRNLEITREMRRFVIGKVDNEGLKEVLDTRRKKKPIK